MLHNCECKRFRVVRVHKLCVCVYKGEVVLFQIAHELFRSSTRYSHDGKA